MLEDPEGAEQIEPPNSDESSLPVKAISLPPVEAVSLLSLPSSEGIICALSEKTVMASPELVDY